jgi:hypothetical protein
VEFEEFSLSNGAKDVKIQDQNNVLLFFKSSVAETEIVGKGATVNKTFYVEMLIRLLDNLRRKGLLKGKRISDVVVITSVNMLKYSCSVF